MRTVRWVVLVWVYLAALRAAWPFVLILTLGVFLCAPRHPER